MRQFVLLLSAVLQVRCQQTYTLPLLGHGIEGETYNVQVMYQLVDRGSGSGGSGVTVTTDDGQTITIAAATATTHTMPLTETDLPIQSQLKNETRTMSTDADISMQVITTINGHSEGYQAIPNDQLGTEYYVSTFCALGGYCQVVIGSTVVGTTQVYVKLPAEVDEIGFCIKNGTWYSKSDTTITLIYPEVVQLETTHDLTGTRIYSDSPVAVVVGSRPTTSSTPMYHLAEQLVPVPEWGTEFFVKPFGTNAYGNIVHITSRYRKTFVTIDGFRAVELTGYGQTIKRRIVPGNTVRIKATQPVQVMLYTGFTYASNETIVNPGMTMVPAVEHWRNDERFACHASNINDVIQVIRKHSSTPTVVGNLVTPNATTVGYTDYMFDEYIQDIPLSSPFRISHTPGWSGIITCDATAIFPIRALTKRSPDPCLHTFADAYPNDGIDNDCDGDIDEDVCYENRMFAAGTYSMFNNTFVGQRSHTENIAGFTLIKFRLRSCGDVKIELLAGNETLVISIAKGVFIIYKCQTNSGCYKTVFQPTQTYTSSADCNTLVPYWIRRTPGELCMGVGPFQMPCSSSFVNVTDVTGLAFTDMNMFGLHSNAVFYYDVYRADCGGLESDWRCTDKANNCWEYESDLCTTYADWARTNCSKFCGFCSPDSVGKMFVVLSPTTGSGAMEFHVVAANTGESPYNSVNNGLQSAKFVSRNASSKDGSTLTKMRSVGSASDRVHVVYTSADSHLTVTASNALGEMSIPVFPLDALGTEYMTLSFSPITNCIASSVGGPTQVRTYSKTGDPMQIPVLTYKDISLTESTGTVISADRPVAVFCYSTDVMFPYWSQLTPTSSWGTHYILPALNIPTPPTGSTNATARILANSANTRVEIFGDFDYIKLLAERGDYLDQNIDPSVTYTVKSNFPVAVAVLYVETASGAKSTITIPPIDNFMDSAAMLYDSRPGAVLFSVVGVAGNDTTFEVAAAYDNSSLFYETQASTSFALSIFGDFSVYSSPVQMSGHLVKDLQTARICTVTEGTAGDGVDNDCDGLIDEGASCFTGYGRYNTDSDLDADFGEDCLESTGGNAVAPPAIPVCYQLIFPINNTQHCYTPCNCPCEWVDDLIEYNNMTQEEKDASNFEKIKPIILLLQIDKTILSTTIAEKESAEDSRASSANIGIVGIVMLTLICCLIGFFDFINVVRYLKNLRKPVTGIMQDTD